MAKRILVFGGTTEARRIADFLHSESIDFTLSVATAVGQEMAPWSSQLLTGRLSSEQIQPLLNVYQLVIDATHPYACLATEQIKAACSQTNTPYLRILRPAAAPVSADNVVIVPNNQAAVMYVNTQPGNILLTTGSKDIAQFTSIDGFSERVFIRMLPIPVALEKCLALGCKHSHLICLQGCFSTELNIELIKLTQAQVVVTKDSGQVGGFQYKLAAAQATNTKLVVIARPLSEEGLTVAEALKMLANWKEH